MRYLSALQNLFDFSFFQTKIASNAKTVIEVEKNVVSGLPFWEISEEELMMEVAAAATPSPSSDLVEKDPDSGSYIANLGYKNQLAQRVVERIAMEKKHKLSLN
jgi:hypothetical protein